MGVMHGLNSTSFRTIQLGSKDRKIDFKGFFISSVGSDYGLTSFVAGVVVWAAVVSLPTNIFG